MTKQTWQEIYKIEKEIFEANMLDGDKVDNCGGAMFTVDAVLDYVTDRLEKELLTARQETIKEIVEMIEKASEQVQGGGNGRRIFTQLVSHITNKKK